MLSIEYHDATVDDFFIEHAHFQPKFHLIFIDELHFETVEDFLMIVNNS